MSNYSIRDLLDYGNGLAYYSDDSGATKFEYFCTPNQPGMGLTETGRKIMRMETDKTTTDMIQGKAIKRAGGTPDFSYPATSLLVVAAFTYS